MSTSYKYGVYGSMENTVVQNALQATETIVYIGTAPVNLVRGYASAGIINKPVRITNKQVAQKVVGYSDDWEAFSLGEAVAAHFDNAISPIGPIVLINVLDPDIHRATDAISTSLAFVGGKAEILTDKIILDTLALDDLTEGTDYAVEYNFAKGAVVISSVGEPITGEVDASYAVVDATKVEDSAIIGGATTDGVYTGIAALTLVNNNLGLIPNVVLAPGRSESPDVYRALIAGCLGIGGHWFADVYADIPVSSLTDTITKANAWKVTNGYESEHSKVFWPQAKKAGKKFHISTIAAVTRLYVNFKNGGIPYESPGNKRIDVDTLYCGSANKTESFDQTAANNLTQKGITTAIRFGGTWRLWGDHTAAYDFDEADVQDPRTTFDVNVSMLKYVINDFQERFHAEIDSPLDKNRIDSILNAEQETLDNLKAQGALIGEPQCFFLEDKNSAADIMAGNFYWDVTQTNTPPLKAASVGVAYSDAGFSAAFV
jgi:phage tail sheath protein FI